MIASFGKLDNTIVNAFKIIACYLIGTDLDTLILNH